MAKKIIVSVLLLSLLVGAFIGFRFFGSNTSFDEPKKYIYIHTGSNFIDVLQYLRENAFIKNVSTFEWMAKKLNYTQNVKPGKYAVKKGESLFTILRTLKSGNQTQVNLVITKLRTNEDFINKIATQFECDSATIATFINSNDSLEAYGVNTNTFMSMVLPNTYSYYWTASPKKILSKLKAESDKFWTEERKAKANTIKLSPAQVYTLGSIIEEETNMSADKGKIASVYLNRLNKGMKLAADPTVKFAMKNFALKRIMHKHLTYSSPYNTYQNTGLPPGPICTVTPKTLDAVLNAPKTDYLFFVAQPNLTGYSNFATNYEQHLKYAKDYQSWLNEYLKSNP